MKVLLLEANELRAGDWFRIPAWPGDRLVKVRVVRRSWHHGFAEWVTLVRFDGGGSVRMSRTLRVEVHR